MTADKPIVLGLIACGQQKAETLRPARELYTGDLFKKSLAHAEKTCDVVYILSARHGMLDLNRLTKPYDQQLPCTPRGRAWTDHVRRFTKQLRAFDESHAGAVQLRVYGGIRYLRLARDAAERLGLAAPVAVLGSLEIGQRLAWLKRELEAPMDDREAPPDRVG